MEKIKIGLIGSGWIGKEHGRNILANKKAELTCIADAKQENIDAFCKKYNYQCKHFSDYQSLLESNVEAVVIASPNVMHAEMCIEAAKKGKHIYCEKPMAIKLDDCKRMRDAIEKAGVKFLIGYHRRLNPLYQYAKKLLEEGKLGRPFVIESDYLHYVPGDWEIWTWASKESIAGSAFHAGTGHNVDLIEYFCGEITEVSCFKGVFLPRIHQIETEDTAIAIFKFKSGAIGKVHLCIGTILPFAFNFRLFGTKGTVINNKVWLDTIPDFAEYGREDDCIELPKSWIPDNVQGGVSETWNKLMDHFIDMLTDNVPCINDAEAAYKTSAVCFAAVESAKTGKIIRIQY